MITNSLQNKNLDSIGALASGLCLIHCIVTPLIFLAQTCTAVCCDTAPAWWKTIDYFFLGVSFIAVYRSSKNTSKSWISLTLWFSWVGLSLLIINEKFELISISENTIYIPAIILIFIHLYNKKYCQCKGNNDKCCAVSN